MKLLKIVIASLPMTLAGTAAISAPTTGSAASACVQQTVNAPPPGKGGWPAAKNGAKSCQPVTTAACAKPESIAGFNGKFGFRVAATAGADCSGKTNAVR